MGGVLLLFFDLKRETQACLEAAGLVCLLWGAPAAALLPARRAVSNAASAAALGAPSVGALDAILLIELLHVAILSVLSHQDLAAGNLLAIEGVHSSDCLQIISTALKKMEEAQRQQRSTLSISTSEPSFLVGAQITCCLPHSPQNAIRPALSQRNGFFARVPGCLGILGLQRTRSPDAHTLNCLGESSHDMSRDKKVLPAVRQYNIVL